MPMRRRAYPIGSGLAAAALWLWLGLGFASMPAHAQFGLAVSGVGPINRSMGGAATAAPLDAAGALYWNPATIGELGHSEMEFGVGFLVPRTTLSSRVGAGALGSGQPPTNLQGNTGGNNGVFLVPAIGLVYSPVDSPWSYGLGIFEIGGFGVNYPIVRNNPILNPQVPFGRGVGPLYTQLQLFQFTPTVALKLTEKFSIGAAANIDMGALNLNPALTSAPSLMQTPLGPAPAYGNGDQGRTRAGGGFQLGAYYIVNDNWSLGASFKSQQWFETYRFNAQNPINGNAASPNFNLNFPMTVSAGLAYRGIDKMLIASDFRFLDYRDTAGFSHTGFNQFGALRGLGWQNVFALGTGIQYQWTDDFSTRIGYTFSLNPVGGALTTFNVGSPTIIQHTLALGASYNVTKTFKLSLAYAHDFQNAISGPLVEPFIGRVPNSSVRTSSTVDSVYLGATVSF
jgi:long-chain fatty acid transport protein